MSKTSKTIWVCPKCGSPEVETWVMANPNTKAVDWSGFDASGTNWCLACRVDLCELVSREDWEKAHV